MIQVEPQVILTNATAYTSSHTMSDVEALSFLHVLTHTRTHMHVHTTHTHAHTHMTHTHTHARTHIMHTHTHTHTQAAMLMRLLPNI